MEKSNFDLGMQAYNDKDYASALSFWKLAAEQGDTDAQCRLGDMYISVQRYTEAMDWYRKAANLGDADAQYYLGLMYNDGVGVPEDYTEALKWYRKAAEQEHEKALCNLGSMYFDGLGVDKNYTEAAKWYRKAAEHGDTIAQRCLGLMYYNGDGVTQDYQESFRLFGLSDDALGLGLSYLYGRGVKKNKPKACEYLVKAAKSGDKNAMKYLNDDYTLKPVKSESKSIAGQIISGLIGLVLGILGGGSNND